jgi:hypothetical protein
MRFSHHGLNINTTLKIIRQTVAFKSSLPAYTISRVIQ